MELDLTAKLVKHFILNDLTLVNLFDGGNEAGLMVPSQKDFSKLSLAENSPHLESIENSGRLLSRSAVVHHQFLYCLRLCYFIQRFEYLFILGLTLGLSYA